MPRNARSRRTNQRSTPMVVIPPDLRVPPEPHEIEAAWILARHFGTTVEFLRPSDSYKVKTADIVMSGQIWELKSPTGRGHTTVTNQLRRASKQSGHVVFDARRIQLDEDEVLRRVRRNMRARAAVKVVLLISKAGRVLDVRAG